MTTNGTLTQHRAYDAANQLLSGSPPARGYPRGRQPAHRRQRHLQLRRHPCAGTRRLTAGASGAQSSSYSYNGDGTLVGQASGGVTTGYAQDLAGGQSQVLAITTGSGAGASTVDQLWGLDRLASLNPATGIRAWYGYDGQGSARQLLNDAGHVTASANYDPYGGPEGAALPSPFGYTGELTDPATGNQYLRARWYRPGQGTLPGVDPALDSTGQPYSYASDNPANGSDPSGRCTVRLGGRAYSYLGAEGPGPCSDVLTAARAGAYRADGALPCLRVLPGRVELIGSGVVPAFVGQPVEAGLPVLGAAPLLALGALGTGEGTTLGEAIAIGIARALPEGLPEGIIGVGVAIFAGVLIGVLTYSATSSSTSDRSDDTCHSGRIVCFSKGADREFAVGDVAYHIERAQQRGKPIVLHYLGAAAVNRNRGKACSEKKKKGIGLPNVRNGVRYVCDEYPFAGTAEGGVNAAIAAVREDNNNYQGTILIRFYRKEFDGQGSPNNWFVVLVIP